MFDSYINRARGAESNYDPYAQNPLSSATGLDQFTSGTWNGMMQQYPDLGLTADGRTDPLQSKRAMERFTQDNANTLKKNGFETTDNNLYALHRFGAGDGTRLLGTDPNAPIEGAVSPKILQANPDLAGKTVGQVLNRWQDGGGVPQRAPGNFGAAQTAQAGPTMDQTAYGGPAPLTPPVPARPPGNFGTLMPNAKAPPAQDGGFLKGGPGGLIGLPNGMTSGGYDVGGALQGVGASLASISSPDQAKALAAINKPNGGKYTMHMDPASGTVLRINNETGVVDKVSSGDARNKYNDAYDTHDAADQIKLRDKHITDAVNAQASNKDLDQLSQAFANPDVPQGPGSNVRVMMMKAANVLGVDNAKTLSDIDLINNVASKMALKLRNPSDGSGMPGNFSDQDRNFLMGIVPGVNLTAEGNKRVIELQRAANDRAIAIDGMRRDYEKQHGGRLDSGFGQVIADWDKSHPFTSSGADQQGGTGGNAGTAPPPAGTKQRPPLGSIFK